MCTGKKISEAVIEKDIVTHKIKLAQDKEKVTDFLDIFGEQEESIGHQEIDFGDVEFDIIEESESKGSQESDIGDIESISKSDEEDIDFGDIEFEELDDISLKKEDTPLESKSLADVGLLSQSPKKDMLDISPQSDISSDVEIDLKGTPLKGTNNIFIKNKEEKDPDLFFKKRERTL